MVEAPMTSLFDHFVRTDASPSAESEDYFTFLNRVDTPFWAEVRRVLDVWFSRYPGERAPALRREFRSRRGRQQRGAFWELYLHELFLQLGYSVVVHPGLANITSHNTGVEGVDRGSSRLFPQGIVRSGATSQVASLIVVQAVAASSPVAHPRSGCERSHCGGIGVPMCGALSQPRNSPLRTTYCRG